MSGVQAQLLATYAKDIQVFWTTLFEKTHQVKSIGLIFKKSCYNAID